MAMRSSSAYTPFMRVLGIDPALAGPTGYGIVESDGRHCRSLEFGAVKARRAREARAAAGVPARLREIHAAVTRLLKQHAPDAVAVESVFTALNMRTALKLAEVRGVVLLAAAERGIPVHSYSPREVKAAVAGYGNADKQQMQQMVRAMLGLRAEAAGLGSDAADALAVALCHIYASQAQQRFTAATAPVPAPRHGAGNGHRAARIQSSR
jgi:crossover junction endodeoxyribonuclease RuvC